MLRVWIDLCDYWTVPFSAENFASCLDRFVRLLTAVPFSGGNFASCLDRFVRLLDCSVLSGELCFVFGSICAIIGLFRSQGRTLLRVWIDCAIIGPFRSQGELCFVFGSICVNIDNYLVLRENTASWFALDFV